MTRAGSSPLWVFCGNQRSRRELAVDPKAHKRDLSTICSGWEAPSLLQKLSSTGLLRLRMWAGCRRTTEKARNGVAHLLQLCIRRRLAEMADLLAVLSGAESKQVILMPKLPDRFQKADLGVRGQDDWISQRFELRRFSVFFYRLL